MLEDEDTDLLDEEEEELEEHYQRQEDKEEDIEVCEICGVGGTLLVCDSCSRLYHLDCLDPPLQSVPEGQWSCNACTGKEKEATERTLRCEQCGNTDTPQGLLCCSRCEVCLHQACLTQPVKDKEKHKGQWLCPDCSRELDPNGNPLQVERILTKRTNSEQKLEYLIKWKDKSYRHCKWVAHHRLAKIARHKLRNFEKHYQSIPVPQEIEAIKKEWLVPQRVIAAR